MDKNDAMLYHKTTAREIYDEAKASRQDTDDVILFNRDGLVTESTIANIVVRMDDRLLTPKISAGLLAGTFREELVVRGEIIPADITVEMLEQADEIFLVNSLRKWRIAKLMQIHN